MRILLMALTEGPADVAPEIAMVLLTIVDRPRTRVFLDGGVDLEVFHVFFWLLVLSSASQLFCDVRWHWLPLPMRTAKAPGTRTACALPARLLLSCCATGAVSSTPLPKMLCLSDAWSGLMYFCMDDMKAIRSLIDTLRIRSLDTRVSWLLL